MRAAVRFDDGCENIVGSTDIVVHGVALLFFALLGIWRSSLFREVDDRVRSTLVDQRRKSVVVFGNVNVYEIYSLAGELVPSCQSLLWVADGCEGVAAQFQIDFSPRKIVHYRDIVTGIGQVQCCWPSTEAVTTENQDSLLGTVTVGTGEDG